jgi:hypothetical protein
VLLGDELLDAFEQILVHRPSLRPPRRLQRPAAPAR